MAAAYPSKLITLPFANSGTRNAIANASHGAASGQASYTDGFPSLTFTPEISGGVPPLGADFNGVLFELSDVARWVSGGGVFKFNSDYATSPGYAVNQAVMLNDGTGLVINTVAGNTNDPNTTMTGWTPYGGGLALAGNYAVDSGVVNAPVAVLSPVQAARKVNGTILNIKMTYTNTGACTLNAGSGAASLLRNDGSALVSGDLIAGCIYPILYDSATTSYRVSTMVPSQITQAEFPGVVKDYAGASIPAGYLLCNGAAISRALYAALFAAIGTTWGSGDGSTTFNIPDFRGRMGLGAGAVSGLETRTLGTSGGSDTHNITLEEMPMHQHRNGIADNQPGGTYPDECFVYSGTTVDVPGYAERCVMTESGAPYWQGLTSYVGSGYDLSWINPYCAVNKIIKY